MMKNNKTRALVECAIFIAIATVLSMFKLLDLPYGGSITMASMLPMVLISYRHGMAKGLTAGLVYGIIQQLLGLNTLSWVTTWQSVVAVILLDYVVAFAVTGFGGIFRKSVKNQALSLTAGVVVVCALRYACHVIAGCTVWAGLSIPTSAALIYSFAYNATYMIPEMLVTAVAAYYLASVMDFRKTQPTRLESSCEKKRSVFSLLAGLFAAGGLIFDAVAIFSKLQNPETGDFMITGLSLVAWTPVLLVTAGCALVATVLLLVNKKQNP
jgi:thiamine transporter